MVHDSEVHAYKYILDKLKEKTSGWSKSQIMTQNELLRDEELAKVLKTEKKGTETPENIIKIKEDIFWVIESKSTRKKWKTALTEAIQYANKINKSKLVRASFVTGLGGNDDEGYFVRSQYLKDGKWEMVTENDVEIPDMLLRKQIETVLKLNDPHLKDIEISDEEFLDVAIDLNKILHASGILKDKRAMFIAAILLAILEGTKIDYSEKTPLLVQSINHRIEILLKHHGKSDFAHYIRLDTPTGTTNHTKYKNAIIKTIQKLNALNIEAAIDSDRDIVGQFYEAFLKYGNGAKDLGIVFTPRHITRFASEIIDVNENDLIFDPTCGTGGFLVAAYDKVKRKLIDEDYFDKFKKFALYGIEDKDPVASLAIVNMIFRKDGKNNIMVGDCLKFHLNSKKFDDYIGAEYLESDKKVISPITKVLMNPPFSQPSSADREYKFVRQGLAQMKTGGLLFSILPISVMIRSGEEYDWRKDELLMENTLLSVITFPPQLFQPQAGISTLGIVVKKGIPHKKEDKVLWVRAIHDGFRLRKGKRLPHRDEEDDFEEVTRLVKQFVKNRNIKVDNKPKFKKSCPIDFDDPLLELLPEAYLDEKDITPSEIESGMDTLIRETVAFIIKTKGEDAIVGDVHGK